MKNISCLCGPTSVRTSGSYNADEKHLLRAKGNSFIGRYATIVIRKWSVTENTIKKDNKNRTVQCTAQAGCCTPSENDEVRAGGHMTNTAARAFSTSPGF